MWKLSITTDVASVSGRGDMAVSLLLPIHPGEILREEYLKPLNLSSGALAKRLGVPRTRIERLVNEQVGVTPDTALRLAKHFGTTPNFWLNMQASYDIKMHSEEIKSELDAIDVFEQV